VAAAGGACVAVRSTSSTPGHLSVLDPVGGVLVVGDALVGRGDSGGVAGPDAAYTQDMDTAHESVRTLAGHTFDTLLFGHGEPVEQDAARLVREFTAQL
jgi:glyoxylase-like metal-dependent hydrolase (beta-lactamase superfamily II)